MNRRQRTERNLLLGRTPGGMKRVTLLDTAAIPGGGELGLYEHGEDFVIKVMGGQDLMSTRTHGSADALAEITCPEVAGRVRPRVLIGGMGMGFTLAVALRDLGSDAEVVVAELVPAVVEWNRGPLGEHAGHPLRDGRVTVQEVDVSLILRAEVRAFDAILLDVDNGPEGLTQKGNDWLYSRAGLNACYGALRPRACLGCGRLGRIARSRNAWARPVSRWRRYRCGRTGGRALGTSSGSLEHRGDRERAQIPYARSRMKAGDDGRRLLAGAAPTPGGVGGALPRQAQFVK